MIVIYDFLYHDDSYDSFNSLISIVHSASIPVAGNTTFGLLMQKEAIKEAVKKEASLKAAKAREQRQKALAAAASNNHKAKKSNDMAKQQNKNKPKSTERSNHVSSGSSEEPPKGLENALKGLKKDKINTIIHDLPARFPNHPIIWLKDLTEYINSRVNQDSADPTFSSKPHGECFSLENLNIE